MPHRKLPSSLVKNSRGQGCVFVILIMVAALFSFVSRGFQSTANNPITDTNTSRQALTFSEATGPRVVLPTATSTTTTATLPVPTATLVEVSSPEQSITFGVWGIVTASVLNVREAPDATATVVGTLSAGECIELVSEGEGWYAVSTENLGGWSSSDYITPVEACPTVAQTAEVVASATTVAEPTESPPVVAVNNTMPSYVGQPFAPNATVAHDGWLYECFGQGNNGLRTVGAGTPIQLLGVGEFVPSSEQQAMMGNGPFYKVRI